VEDTVPAPRRVVHEASAYLVSNMLRSVINEGTAYPVRQRGFHAEAAGKTGTSNENRDAWFAGFTPDLLAVVWVGYDDNTPLQLPAADVALPIWVDFMRAALAGREPSRFPGPPEGVTVRWIDKYTGLLARAGCPGIQETFIAGTEPTTYCSRFHEPVPVEPTADDALGPERGFFQRVFGGLGRIFKGDGRRPRPSPSPRLPPN
jgi:membrane carboxypeptidase/penicillin-binding protein